MDDGKLSEILLKNINEILVQDILSEKYMGFEKSYLNSKKGKKLFLSALDVFLETRSCKPIVLFSRILVEALREKNEWTFYPKNVVEHTLLAFAWKKADKRTDMEELVKAAVDSVDFSNNSNTNFNQDFYFSCKKKQKDEPESFENEVFSNPELASFFGHGHEIYENEYPLLITYGQARLGEYQFPDCVETMIRNFFNILLYDNRSNKFEVDKLKNTEIKVSDELISFYANYPTISLQKTQRARNDWATIVSNKENVKYLQRDKFNPQKGYEMASDIINVVMLLQNFVPISKDEIKHEYDRNKKLSTARDYLLTFLHNFSDPQYGRQWSISAKNETFDSDNLCIAVENNEKAVFNLNIGSMHGSLEYEQKLNKKNNFNIDFLEKNKNNLDFYVLNLSLSSERLFFLRKYGCQDRSEIVFSCNLYDSDEMANVIDFVLSQKLDVFYKFLDFWLSTLPIDDNNMKLTLYEIFKKNTFDVENYTIAAKIVQDVEAMTEEEVASYTDDQFQPESLLSVAVEKNLINTVKEFLKKIDLEKYLYNEAYNAKGMLLNRICKNNLFDMLELFINTEKITQEDIFRDDTCGGGVPFCNVLKKNNYKMLDLIINSVGVCQGKINKNPNYYIYPVLLNNNSEQCLRRLIDSKILSKEQLIDFSYEKTDFLSLLSTNKECDGLLNYVVNEIKFFSAEDFLRMGSQGHTPIIYAILKQKYNNFHKYLKICSHLLSDYRISVYILYFLKLNLDDEAVKCVDYFKINFKDRIKKILKSKNEKGSSVLDFLIINKNKNTLNHFIENLIFEPEDFADYEAFFILTDHIFNSSLLKKRLERDFEVCNEGEPKVKKSRELLANEVLLHD
ncbi:MAG: hypothetical protein Q8L85_07665 [Alphaproteobacteria bacterium]|nr:hypothetical protein [Alphaproteobacteria bacterium]